MTKTRHVKKVFSRNSVAARGKRLLHVGFFLFLLLFISSSSLFLYYAKDLPRPERLNEITFAQATKIYDRTGSVLLYELFGEETREFAPLNEIPQHLKEAVLATEDRYFYQHFGIDWRGVGRSLLKNLRLRDPSQFVGGSTISQQLVRSILLSREKTVPRKIKEVILTLELERRYSKDEILEFYLNQVPLGSTVYGVGAATRFYFGKPVTGLSLAESAAVAALIQAPSYYSPHGLHKEELMARKDYVLGSMELLGYISKEEAAEAQAEELAFRDPGLSIKAPHFTLYVVDQLLKTYGEEFLRESGLKVYTTLDWKLQEKAEEIIATVGERNAVFDAHNAALVALDPATGEILAMVGSKNWFGESYPEGCVSGQTCSFDPKVNVATYRIGRQPGSAFKPFAYVTAFTKGYNDATTVVDEETNFGIWGDKEYIPANYDGKFRGTVTLRQSLAQSLNIPSIKVLLNLAGLQESVATAHDMGITTLQDPSRYGPSIVLGGGEVKLLDITSAYGVFATGGKRVPPSSIMRVASEGGVTLQKNTNTPITILPKEAVDMITSILSDNEARTPIFGANSLLYFPNRQVAVKTGTTQDFRDGWVVGYSPNTLVTGVWVGNNDNSPMNKEPGIVVAGPIWRAFMDYALK
ncbi:MAG: transglycosylase domain-containing protein [Candidatus Wildermuthbacteria bacterium]|nr:transglycosylase domain-containing protein [Candidatus Wildermuthbacteria bacterium]